MKELAKTAEFILTFAVVLLLPLFGSARAQWGMDAWTQQLMSFDQQFDAQLGSMMAANQAQMRQLLQGAAGDPQVQAAYQQYLQSGQMPVPYEQFVYYWVMTAGGANVQGGLQAQQNAFNGMQQANATVQSGFDSYNQGYWQNQATMDQTMDNYSTYAIQGNGYYSNPYTGEVYTLPYTSGPGYYESEGYTFYMDEIGQYWQYQGGGWQLMNPYRQ